MTAPTRSRRRRWLMWRTRRVRLGASRAGFHRPTRSLLVLSAADFLVVLDGLAVSVALPDMQRDLGFSGAGLQWVVNAYVLAFGGFLLLGGRLADVLGRRRVFVTGLLVFAGASLLAGLAPGPVWLVAFRAVQGLGAALVVPSALSILPTLFPDEAERDKAVGFFSAAGSAGIPIGAVVGGLLTSALGWRWVLLCVVPFAVVAALMAPTVPRSRPPEVDRRVRLGAAAAGTAGLAVLVGAFTVLAEGGHAWPRALLLLAVAAVVLAGFAAIERRSRPPLVDRGLFADPVVRAANLTGAVLPVALGAVLFVGTLYVQDILGYSALGAGLAFLPMSVLLIVVSPVAARLTSRYGRRATASGGLLLQGAGLLLLAGMAPDRAPLAFFLAGTLLVGFGAPVAFVPVTRAALSVGRVRTGAASGVFNTVQQVGNGLALGLVVAAVGLWTARSGDEAEAAARAAGYRAGFVLAAVLLAAGVVAASRLPGREAVPAAGDPAGTDLPTGPGAAVDVVEVVEVSAPTRPGGPAAPDEPGGPDAPDAPGGPGAPGAPGGPDAPVGPGGPVEVVRVVDVVAVAEVTDPARPPRTGELAVPDLPELPADAVDAVDARRSRPAAEA